jgi:hypothetical protein
VPQPKRIILIVLAAWQLLMTILMTLGGRHKPVVHAVACMVWGIDLLWIGGAGLFTYLFRDAVRNRVLSWRLSAALKFLILATTMALVEEMVTTLMTNCAPLFGVRIGEAYITASTNYLDVITFHSVVVIAPQLAAWAWMFTRYAFRPFDVFILYGLTGFVSEAIFAGQLSVIGLAQWILVYGLMAYLPAYCVAAIPGRRPVKWWQNIGAVFLPILAAIPVAIAVMHIAPKHPSIHFPRMK